MREGIDVVFGSGPVGSAVARALLASGRRIRLVNRRGAMPKALALGLSEEAGSRIELARAEATDFSQALAASRGAARIFHCANPLYHQWAEVLPPLQAALVKAALKEGALLVASENLYMYARGGTIREGTRIDPPSQKGRIRQALFESLQEAGQKEGLSWVTARASDYYGPGSEGQSVFGSERFLEPLLAGKRVSFIGDPDAPHSYTYIGDFGRALTLVAGEPAAWGRSWIVPNAPALSTRELGRLFVRSLERRLPSLVDGKPRRFREDFGHLPRALLRALGLVNPTIRELDEMLYQKEEAYLVDGSELASRFGLVPTSLEAGVEESLDSFLALR